MPIPRTIKREFEVAFARHAQPLWVRVFKYLLLAALIYFLRGSRWLWPVLGTLLVLSLTVHLWYRKKTRGWTQSFGGWDYEKNKPRN